MKTYVIRDESRTPALPLGYLQYYEKSRSFVIELDDSLPPNEFPLLFYEFVRKGIFTIDPGWSRRWVQARIVPRDRQNLADILRVNGLKEYDEMKLLHLSDGRCAQDYCSIAPVTGNDLPRWMQDRKYLRLETLNCLPGALFVLTYADGSVRLVHLQDLITEDNRWLSVYAEDDERFRAAQLLPGGTGIFWGDERRVIPLHLLRGVGVPLALTAQQMRLYAYQSAIDTSEACRVLNCSRQYLHHLVQSEKLHPMTQNGATSLFFRGDVERLTW